MFGQVKSAGLELMAYSSVARSAFGIWAGAASGLMAGTLVTKIIGDTHYSGTIKAAATCFGIHLGGLLGYIYFAKR